MLRFWIEGAGDLCCIHYFIRRREQKGFVNTSSHDASKELLCQRNVNNKRSASEVQERGIFKKSIERAENATARACGKLSRHLVMHVQKAWKAVVVTSVT